MPNTMIRTEYNKKPSKTVRVYMCSYKDCAEEVRIREDNKSHSGMCQRHSHQKRPYESIYNCFCNDWRGLENTITYEEFLEFTKVNSCFYCQSKIDRLPYSINKGEYTSRAYYLDRKDSSLGYSKDNCVVCCTSCNKIKGSNLTYDEMIVAMKAVVEYRQKIKRPELTGLYYSLTQ